ncbi:hypothetical protein GCM10018785_53620 [Streptomyces longispororuber]|uniref:Uncharacterized protein n=1 Tax=Streptomyces longispororuber TaxID=68230 RepID=A0A919A0Z9_9ACTN|nr:hypothetical protein GCM10018785_53620 [Streptomyces longispororuber]
MQSGGEAHPKVTALRRHRPQAVGVVTAGRYELALTTCHPREVAACHPYGTVPPTGRRKGGRAGQAAARFGEAPHSLTTSQLHLADLGKRGMRLTDLTDLR